MNRTNGETSKWINSQKNLSLRAGFEEANTFFGTFPGDHKTFGTWKESFLRKEKKIKNEAQQRVMKEVGGSGKQYYTPPVEYMPPLQSFGFVSKTLKCEKCQSEFETALSVSAHIRSAHHEELRKMFAKDARENLEGDSEYQVWLDAPTVYKNDETNVIKELESANEVLKRRLNEERRDTYKKVGERDGIIETEKVIFSEDGKIKIGVVKEHFAKVTKRCSVRVENEDPNKKRSREKIMREQSEKVENVLHHFADDKSKKAKILARIVDREGADFASEVFLKSKELKETKKFTAEQTASILSNSSMSDRDGVKLRTACNKELGYNPFASRHKVEEVRNKKLVIKREDCESSYEEMYKNKQGKEARVKKNTCVFTVKNLHQYIEKLAREEAENLPNSGELQVCLGGDGGGGRFVSEVAFLNTLDKSIKLHPIVLFEGTDCRENLVCTFGKLTPQIRKLEGAQIYVKGRGLKLKVFACLDLCALNAILGEDLMFLQK